MSLTKLFNPSSIAIVGVSYDQKKVGYLVAKNLLDQGYEEDVYFINKDAAADILGHKVYKHIGEIQKPIDLVVLAIPAAPALAYLEELHDAGIRNVVLFAAGFKEIGAEGQENENLLVEKCQDYNLNLLGPNCIGFINSHLGVNTTFLKHISPKGNIGFVSQSGALGSVMVDYFAAHTNLGFSYFVSIGNKSIIDESDILRFLANDQNTAVIGMYLEDIKDGKKFTNTLKEIIQKKPVVVLKSGSTAEGSKAALSHTGGLVGDDQVYSAVFKQHGLIRAHRFNEFTELLKLYSFNRVPKASSVVVLSNAGGVGVLAADEMVQNELVLQPIPESLQQQIVEAGSTKKMTLHNPIDLLGDATVFDYTHALEVLKDDQDIGALCVLLTPQANTEVEKIAVEIGRVQEDSHLPIYPIFIGEKSVMSSRALFEQKRIASFTTFDNLPFCLHQILWQQEYVNHTKFEVRSETWEVSDDVKKILEGNKEKAFLHLGDSMNVMKKSGIPILDLHSARTVEELKTTAHQLGFPLVLKIVSDVTHKTEVSGVITSIQTEDELLKAYEKMMSSGQSDGVYVQKMAKGFEVFLGAKRDPNFGVVIVAGLGGIYAELLKDVSYRVFPFSQEEFMMMIRETKLYKLFAGFRGSRPVDITYLYDIVMQIGLLMEEFMIIKEIDLNPLFASSEGVTVVDCRIILS